jgi:hypothetical protein
MLAQAILSTDHPHNSRALILSFIAANDVNSLEALFLVEPDSLFANPEFEFNLALYADTINPNSDAAKLLTRLGKQFEADKRAAKEWQPLFYFFLTGAQFFFHNRNFQLSSVIYGHAIYYAEKIISKGKDMPACEHTTTQQLYLKVAQCAAKHFNSIKHDTSLPKINEQIITLKRTIRAHNKAIELAKEPQEETILQIKKNLNEYQIEHSKLESKLAASFNDEADYLQIEMLTQTHEIDLNCLNRIATLYGHVKLHLQRAHNAAVHAGVGDQKVQAAQIITGLIDDLNQVNNKLANLPSAPSMQLQHNLAIHELSELVGDFDTPIAEIESFLNENKIDVDDKVGFININRSNGQTLIVETSPLHNAVANGSLLAVKYLVEVEKAKLPLFTTQKTLGLYNAMSMDTHPEVSEYMLEPPEKFLQGDPDREFTEFLIHSMAGRLGNVEAYLQQFPDAIFKNPISRITNEASDGFTVLYLALLGQQLHIIHYLETFIMAYAVENLKLGSGDKLKFLLKALSTCYNVFGWTAERHDTVDQLTGAISDLFQKQIEEFYKKPGKDKSPDAIKQNEITKFNSLELLFWTGQKYETHGKESPPQKAGSFFYLAKAAYKRCLELIELNHNYLRDIPHLPALIDAVLQSNDRITQAISKIAEVITPITFEHAGYEYGYADGDDDDEDDPEVTVETYFDSDESTLGVLDEEDEEDVAKMELEETKPEEHLQQKKRKSPSSTTDSSSLVRSAATLFKAFKIEDLTSPKDDSPKFEADEDEKTRIKQPRKG